MTYPRTQLPHVVQQRHLLLPKGRFGAEGIVICLVLLHIKVSNMFLFSITRLSKLEAFQKIVVEELASLEKETQILANMEKDAVVCMTSCASQQRYPFPNNGVFLWGSLGLLERAVPQTEFFLQPAKAKVRLYQLSCMLTIPLMVK